MKLALLTTLAPLLFSTALAADDANDPAKAYLNAAEAGAEFAIQGEYAGGFKTGDGEVRIGVQVIAEGQGKLAWAAYIGGLPGDGWDGNTPLRGAGEIQGDKGILKGDTGRGEIKDGSLVIYTADNVRVGEIAKTTRVSGCIISRFIFQRQTRFICKLYIKLVSCWKISFKKRIGSYIVIKWILKHVSS